MMAPAQARIATASGRRTLLSRLSGQQSPARRADDHKQSRAGRVRIASDARIRDWLLWLDPLDAELVEMRVSGAPWKPICWRLGMSRATAHRRWKAALVRITDHLAASAPVIETDINDRG